MRSPPAPGNFDKPLCYELPSAMLLHRIHLQDYNACASNDTDRGKACFSPIRDVAGQLIPTIYAAVIFYCASLEIILRAPSRFIADPTLEDEIRTIGDMIGIDYVDL